MKQQTTWKIILHASSKPTKKRELLIVVLWISFTAAAFSYFVQDKLVHFNVNNKLNYIEIAQLTEVFTPYIDSTINETQNTVIHFSQPNCQCTQYSEKHIQDINRIASKHRFNIINVPLSTHDIIPATPSIAILNKTGEVVYFGPYGQGIACSKTAGYAQTVLHNFIKGYSANVMIKNAKGCYCAV